MKLSHPVSVGALLLAASTQHVASAHPHHPQHPPVAFGAITTGKTTLYHTQNGVPRNDLSGAATDGRNIVFADDGGDAGVGYGFNFVRVTSGLPDTNGYNIPLTSVHTDAEDITFARGWFYLTTSFSSADPTNRILTRFKLDAQHQRIKNEQSVDLHASLNEALRVDFGDEWYDSWKNLPAKSGGLNIEGIARSDKKNEDALVFGLRSPLFGGDFPTNLHSGDAILAKVKRPFSNHPTYDFLAVDLGGLGIRGVEWIPALDSYVIAAGPVEKATEYALYQVFPDDGTVRPLALPGMESMCRPESVMQETKNGKDYLVVFSEDSGPECAGVPFTYIRAEIRNNHNHGNGHGCNDDDDDDDDGHGHGGGHGHH
jgi:hypothetical protein